MITNAETLKEMIRRELPDLLRDDPNLRTFVLDIARSESASKKETQDRFWEMLAEIRRDREEQSRKWDEQNGKWEEQNRKWDEAHAELRKDREAQARKWEGQNRKWEEQNRKWEENTARLDRDFDRMHEEVMAVSRRIDRSIGALGARWGTQSEAAFRNALAGILERNFGVQVLNVNEFDDKGVVFGRPEQVELDIIIKNGLLLICEIKSSIDKAGMYIFERKARFYEERHNSKAERLIVISPMIAPKARKVAENLGITLYSDSDDVESL